MFTTKNSHAALSTLWNALKIILPSSRKNLLSTLLVFR